MSGDVQKRRTLCLRNHQRGRNSYITRWDRLRLFTSSGDTVAEAFSAGYHRMLWFAPLSSITPRRTIWDNACVDKWSWYVYCRLRVTKDGWTNGNAHWWRFFPQGADCLGYEAEQIMIGLSAFNLTASGQEIRSKTLTTESMMWKAIIMDYGLQRYPHLRLAIHQYGLWEHANIESGFLLWIVQGKDDEILGRCSARRPRGSEAKFPGFHTDEKIMTFRVIKEHCTIGTVGRKGSAKGSLVEVTSSPDVSTYEKNSMECREALPNLHNRAHHFEQDALGSRVN